MSDTKRPFPIVTTVVGVALVSLGLAYAFTAYEPADWAATDAAEPERIQTGSVYYVFVDTVELAPVGLDGEAWDIDDSAPDVGYQIAWQGQTVFESSEVNDTLIARWSGLKIGMDEAMSLLKKGKADPGQIVDAALMRAQMDGRFVISFHDSDLTGDDPCGELMLPWEELRIGANTVSGAVPGRGLVSATIRIIPGSGDLFSVLKSLSSKTP